LAGKKTGKNPTNRAKSGVKRSVLTDANGIPLAVAVSGANTHDMRMTQETVENIQAKRPKPTKKKKQNMCLDKGYDFDEVRDLLKEFGYTEHIPKRGEDAKRIKKSARKKARRWVVERTHSWMNRFRGLLIRWSKKPENYIALLHMVCALITWRSTGLLR